MQSLKLLCVAFVDVEEGGGIATYWRLTWVSVPVLVPAWRRKKLSERMYAAIGEPSTAVPRRPCLSTLRDS